MTHRIAAITFVPRTNDGPAECSCGWSGQASEFAAHSSGSGQRAGMRSLRLPPMLAGSSWWNATKAKQAKRR